MIVNSNNTQLHYTDSGQGTPVMLIHGFPLCHKMWQPQAQALLDAGYRVILPDLRGFGSSPAGTATPSIDRYADDLVALLDHLNIEQAVIGGMSMGGYVLLNLLARYPQRVAAACFIVTRADGDDDTARAKRNHLLAEVDAGRPQAVADAFTQVLFGPGIPDQQPELVAEVRSWMLATSPEGLRFGLTAIRDRADSTALLPEQRLPSLVIGAELDRALPVEKSYAIARAIPGARLQIVRGAGHMANREKSEVVNEMLLEFLSTTVPGPE